MCSSAPNTDGLNAAAIAQANLSKEQLDWAKQLFAETAPDRAAATARANEVSDAQLEAMNTQTGLAKDYADYNKETFRPLEQGIVADANGYATPERTTANVERAQADVQAGFDNAEGQQRRAISRMGINPSSGKSLALSNQTGIQKAAALAGAASKARLDTETIGAAKKMDAASLGRGLPSAQATSAGLAVSQGNSAVTNGVQPVNVNAQGSQIMTQGFNGAQAGLSGAAGTYGQIAGIQQRTDASNNSTLGTLGTAAGMFLSDKSAKKNIKPVSGKASLAALRKVPVSDWSYKKGLGDGKRHVGPMAQDVHKGLGDSVAPRGKKIDLISMSGHQTNAIKELDRRLAKVEKRA